jgi:tRNA-Thr(GGU) m(6)t(6)A37 methyltransferase TsaA
MSGERFEVVPVGHVESSLVDRSDAPKQGTEGAPEAWLVIDPTLTDALDRLAVGDEVVVLTWLHEARRDVLQVHPRSDPATRLHGVFATRSPDRPNPIGLHPVRILAIDGHRLKVSDMEAVHGTPVLDIKPPL